MPVEVGSPLGEANGTSVVEVDPISRIEGHLGVKLEQTSGYVTEADVHGNLWRGFENFLLGREVNDAITFVQRICGVCPVPHGMTSTYAVDAVLGYSQNHITFAEAGGYGVPKKAVYIRNLVLGAEFLMSSITHFYHLAAPSYVQGPAIPPWTPFFADDYYHVALRNPGGTSAAPSNSAGFSTNVWSTVIRSYVLALRIRRLTFEAGALFAGRMPMTSVYVGGGVTFDKSEDLADRCSKFKAIMEEIARFVIQEYVPIALVLGALYPNFDNKFNNVPTAVPGDDDVVTTGGLTGTGYGVGAGVGNFLAWGGFPDPDDDSLTLPGGVWTGGSAGSGWKALNKADILYHFVGTGGVATNSVPVNLREDISHSRYADSLGEYNATTKQAYPGAVSRTEPHRSNGYTYSKAPRWGGQPMEVGPFARLVVAGYYPVDGRTLASVVPGYGAYVKTVGAVTGLDPKMIAADIAVALVRASLAQLNINGTIVDANYLLTGNEGGPLTEAQIVAAYTNADAVIVGTVTNWVYGLKGGLSTADRLRGRALESYVIAQAILGTYNKTNDTFGAGIFGTGWINRLAAFDAANPGAPTWRDLDIPAGESQGWGATEAPRGALMHQCTIVNGKITKYQCIVPTTWNMSPKDYLGQRGPIEQSMIGAPYSLDGATFKNQAGVDADTQGGVEALRIAQSFDPCIACAIH